MSKKKHEMKKRKIYLAGRYSRRLELAGYADQICLLDRDYEITADWLRNDEVGRTWSEIAVMDYEDVLRADLVISFTEPFGSENVAGGRHNEFGFAYAKNIKCWLVGELETVFHSLPGVKHFGSFEHVLKRLAR